MLLKNVFLRLPYYWLEAIKWQYRTLTFQHRSLLIFWEKKRRLCSSAQKIIPRKSLIIQTKFVSLGIGCIQGGNKIRVVASFKISCKEKIEAMAFLKREIQKIWNRIFNLSMNRFERKVSVLGWWNGRRCLLMPDAPTASKEYFRVPANRISLLHAFYISWFSSRWLCA